MITISVRTKGNEMRADFMAFQRRMGELVGQMLQQEACLTARAALKYAPPIVPSGGKGDTAAAGKTGERAIDKDVRAIFAPRGTTLPAVFSQNSGGQRSAFSAWRKRAFTATSSTILSKIYNDPDEDRAFRKARNLLGGRTDQSKELNNAGQMRLIHEGQRKNGRVVREGRPTKQIKRYPYIAKDSLIKQYIKRRSLEVGKLKSGWWEIISTYGRGLVIFGRTVDAGAKGLPKYITRHSGNGEMTKMLNGSTKKIVIKNNIGDNDGAGLRTKTFALVLAHRAAAIAKRPYQTHIDKFVRNWNTGQRPD